MRSWFILLSFQFVFSFSIKAISIYIRTSNYQIGTASVVKTTLRQDTLIDLNPTPFYAAQNGNIQVTIHNLDTLTHELSWSDQITGVVIPALGSVTVTRNLIGAQVYTLSCTDFIGQTLGGVFSIIAGIPNTHLFYWELWEMQASLSYSIWNQTTNIFPNPYRPNVFTINGSDYPLNMNDSLGLVQGQVGDSIYICVYNAGSMPHALHFHGYHFKILSSIQMPGRVNWEKDSGPILPKDGMVLLVVPDKPGNYPVHDHNLTANTSNAGYPGGMMTMLMIEP